MSEMAHERHNRIVRQIVDTILQEMRLPADVLVALSSVVFGVVALLPGDREERTGMIHIVADEAIRRLT